MNPTASALDAVAPSGHVTPEGPCGAELENDAAPGVAPDSFKAVLRHHASGVAVITAAGLKQPVGFCATSLASVSLKPPLVSFAVGLNSQSGMTMRTARHVAVHLLSDLQKDLANGFAQPGAVKFATEISWHTGPHRLPILDGVVAWMVVEPTMRIPAGDHTLVVGRVTAAASKPELNPLLYHDGGFRRMASNRSSETMH
jgi:flavin reductase (DIM6/NTAB) family NADH-FMN oxidoreductase RutF